LKINNEGFVTLVTVETGFQPHIGIEVIRKRMRQKDATAHQQPTEGRSRGLEPIMANFSLRAATAVF
jgi:hypothetical protein